MNRRAHPNVGSGGDALRAFDSFGMNADMIDVIEDHARLAALLGRAEDAARLHGAACAARERLSLPRSPRLERDFQESLASTRSALSGSAFQAAWQDGRQSDLAQSVKQALLVDGASA